jgi:hypothetical protein
MFLHDIFYPEYKPIVDITVFEKFMFTTTISSFCNIEEKEEKKEEEEEEEEEEKENPIQEKEEIKKEEGTIFSRLEKECVFTKNVQDGLFWSIYILQYGYNEYDRNKYNYGKIEVQEKEKIAEYLHTNGSQKISKQTNYKITRGFCCEIESDLITKPKMTFSALIGMCAYYKCNIFIVDLTKNIYYSFSCEDDNKTLETYVLYKNPLYTGKYKSNEYFIDIDHKLYSLLEIKERFFKIENFQKPMKSITSYKKIELEYIATKISIVNDKEKMDKTQLYEKILLHVCDLEKTSSS